MINIAFFITSCTFTLACFMSVHIHLLSFFLSNIHDAQLLLPPSELQLKNPVSNDDRCVRIPALIDVFAITVTVHES